MIVPLPRTDPRFLKCHVSTICLQVVYTTGVSVLALLVSITIFLQVHRRQAQCIWYVGQNSRICVDHLSKRTDASIYASANQNTLSLKNAWSYTSAPPHAFMVCTGTVLPLPLLSLLFHTVTFHQLCDFWWFTTRLAEINDTKKPQRGLVWFVSSCCIWLCMR